MNATLEKIRGFHGHLGPFVVIGYRMGLLANEALGGSGFSKKATVMTGTKPSISCMIDGIQLSSGCTTGKGNLVVEDRKEARAIFTDREGIMNIEISLREEIRQRIEAELTRENEEDMSIEMFRLPDDELFVVSDIEKA